MMESWEMVFLDTFKSILFNFWRLWAKSLGEKASKDNREADRVALIRTVIILIYLVTNIFIISGVIRHW